MPVLGFRPNGEGVMHPEQGPGNGQKPENATVPVERQLSRALESQRAGRLEEAERLYREILDDHPENADASHLLGLIAGSRRDWKSAESLIARAVRLRPSIAAYRFSLAAILQEQGNLAEALAQCDEVVRIDKRAALRRRPRIRHSRGRDALGGLLPHGLGAPR